MRLPVGFFTLGPAHCADTAFAGAPAQVHQTAWKHVLDICGRLHAAGIGVLIDLHALPGGANGDGHSGTGSGKAALWSSGSDRARAGQCAVFVAREIAAGKVPNAVGIELCNEAAWGAQDMYAFYADTVEHVSAVDSSIPIYISDAWNLSEAVAWAAKHNAAFGNKNPVVVDMHTYYTFTEADRSCTPQQILRRLPDELTQRCPCPDNVLSHGAAPLFIGEYSCVLDGRTWSRVPAGDRDGLVREFGAQQVSRAEKHAMGTAFWTLKMDWMDGGEWGFVEMTKRGAIKAPERAWLSATEVEDCVCTARVERDGCRAEAVAGFREQHVREARERIWAPGRFEAGFDAGWTDALAFFGGRGSLGFPAADGADRIGSLDAWVLKRLRDVGKATGTWEWERGFRRGVAGADGCLLRARSAGTGASV